MTGTLDFSADVIGIKVETDYATIANSGANNKDAVLALMNLIAQNETDGDAPSRGFFDEMSHPCRVQLWKHLSNLRAAIANTV